MTPLSDRIIACLIVIFRANKQQYTLNNLLTLSSGIVSIPDAFAEISFSVITCHINHDSNE
jgi:hypothetical protein